MKEFRTIQDALDYQKKCPICYSHLNIDQREVDMRWDTDYRRTTLTWSSHESKLVIDLETNAVLSFSMTRSMSPIYGIGYSGPISYLPATTGMGHIMERLIVGCDKCCQYDYVIQVIVDAKEGRIVGLLLNSECLTIDEKSTTHEIRNVYSFDKTEYLKHDNSHDSTHTIKNYVGTAVLSLPLIPLDLENPHKTLERIKTLVLFS
jgi:hypothetical protein